MDLKGLDPQAGRLLVATPLLGDPNFRRTVVLVVEHEEIQGTLGVVLNRLSPRKRNRYYASAIAASAKNEQWAAVFAAFGTWKRARREAAV